MKAETLFKELENNILDFIELQSSIRLENFNEIFNFLKNNKDFSYLEDQVNEIIFDYMENIRFHAALI